MSLAAEPPGRSTAEAYERRATTRCDDRSCGRIHRARERDSGAAIVIGTWLCVAPRYAWGIETGPREDNGGKWRDVEPVEREEDWVDCRCEVGSCALVQVSGSA